MKMISTYCNEELLPFLFVSSVLWVVFKVVLSFVGKGGGITVSFFLMESRYHLPPQTLKWHTFDSHSYISKHSVPLALLPWQCPKTQLLFKHSLLQVQFPPSMTFGCLHSLSSQIYRGSLHLVFSSHYPHVSVALEHIPDLHEK